MENTTFEYPEYLCIKLNLQNIKEEKSEFIPKDIEEQKRKGYELICVDQGIAYLKRIKEE